MKNGVIKMLKLIKIDILTQVFSCKLCEILKNTYFEKHLRTTTSVLCIHIICWVVIFHGY